VLGRVGGEVLGRVGGEVLGRVGGEVSEAAVKRRWACKLGAGKMRSVLDANGSMCLIGSTASSISIYAQHQTAKNHVPIQKERQIMRVTVIGPPKKVLGASHG
jgi:hypothetical protein